MLFLHQVANRLAKILAANILGVRGFGALEDATAVGKQMRNDVGILDSRILRLNMEHTPTVFDVVIESEKWRLRLAHEMTPLTQKSETPSGYHTLGSEAHTVEPPFQPCPSSKRRIPSSNNASGLS